MEKELEVQIGMKQEMELSMKMLEKDICEKQDALVELRQQLEDLRAINQQLSHKSQVTWPEHAGVYVSTPSYMHTCSLVARMASSSVEPNVLHVSMPPSVP